MYTVCVHLRDPMGIRYSGSYHDREVHYFCPGIRTSSCV